MTRTVSLKEISERIDYGLTTSAVLHGDGPRFLRITDIDGSFVKWDSVPRCETSGAEAAKYALDDGDIVVARTGASTGRSQWIRVNEPAVFASYLVRFRVRPDFDSRFVSYVLGSKAWFDHVSSVAHGKSAQPNMSASEMARFQFRCPGLSEQRAIAEVLSALDDKIVSNTSLCRTAERLAIAILSSSQATVPLESLVTHHKKSRNPSLMSAQKVAHFSLPAFDAGQAPEITFPANIKSSKFAIDQPSVLVSKLNPQFPRVWNVTLDPGVPALASTEFLVLEPLYSSTTVLWSMLSQPSFGASLQSKVAGTSGSHQRVKPSDLLATLVPDPRSLDRRLQEQITAIGLRSAHTHAENEQLELTRDALLPQLMSGKLRVKDAENALENAGV